MFCILVQIFLFFYENSLTLPFYINYNSNIEVFIMELYAKGQLSYLILTCMQDRDFYGLDIISEISERSNGRINLKKPSVYSNLTRMEKQGYISSYLRNSDFGPNRKYYSLTEKGREFYQELKGYFDRNDIDVFRDFADEASPVETHSFLSEQTAPQEEKPQQDEQPAEPILPVESEEKEPEQDADDFFDFSFNVEESVESQDEKIEIEAVVTNTSIEREEVIEERIEEENNVQIEEIVTESPAPAAEKPAETYSIKQALLQKTEEEKETTDGGVFLTQESADEYNKRIYDISKDINKYKKKRSFAEDQISMSNTSALAASQEKKQSNIDDFKNALLLNKAKYSDRLNKDDFDKQMGYRYDKTSLPEKKEQPKEEIKNDAVYITNRISENDIEKARKIEPPQLKIIAEGFKESKLPAPKRDSSIDPSHKEILSNLYSRTRDNSAEEVREDSIYDYNDLKDYYTNQAIEFNIYQKPTRKIKHNTNKLYLMVSLITLACAGLLSLTAFLVSMFAGWLTEKTTCLYWILPLIFLVDVIWKLIKYKQSSGWLPRKILPQWLVWSVYILLSGAVVGVNFLFGFAPALFAEYATTIILPLALTFAIVPFRYYATRIAIIKFWR